MGKRSWSDFLSRYWELIFFIGYGAVLAWFVVPELKWDYDGHDAALLMSSIRIWAGQVPYRDFYPWYGPLYHYLLALFVRPLGNNLYAVKVYIDLLSPLLSMGILIFTLRRFGLPSFSRLFALLASIYFSLERIYYCGSLRSFLPVFLVAWLYSTYVNRRNIQMLFIFPAACVLFLFTPESGIYTMLTSCIFVLTAMIYSRVRKGRFTGGLYFALGAAFGIIAMLVLYVVTDWFGNYLEFVSVVSKNLYWSHGASLSGLPTQPSLWLVYRLPLIYVGALLFLAGFWFYKKRLNQYTALVLTLTMLGALLASRTLIRFHETHLQFAWLPAVIVASLLWVPPNRPVRLPKIIVQILLVIILGAARYLTEVVSLGPVLERSQYQPLLGVMVPGQTVETFLKVEEHFRELNAVAKVSLPLSGLEYAFLGRVPELPFDDLHYFFYPRYQEIFFRALEKRNPMFLLITENNIFWDYTGDSVDAFFDYIDSRYVQILRKPPVHVYQRRPAPINIFKIVQTASGPFFLNRSNQYTESFLVPPDPSLMFVQFQAEFKYRYGFLSRLSMPIVRLYFDQRPWAYLRPQSGRERLEPLQGKHGFRAYLYHDSKTMDLQITFPGMLNVRPEQIKVTDVQWGKFQLEQLSPRDTAIYELQ